jgi:uncharacterized flavoprotein (TIGR03862 family)
VAEEEGPVTSQNPVKTAGHIAIVGGGPAGLIAAGDLADRGHQVTIYDRMPSVGRKFLLAGRGGLNLTHSEPLDVFLTRYGTAEPALAPLIRALDPAGLRAWSHALGEDTFIGSSGRVFPKSFKASPLLRAWLRQLGDKGVSLRTGHCWTGWTGTGPLRFETAGGMAEVNPDATLLAMGGASWPRLGSNGSWVSLLAEREIAIAPLRPANCGFTVTWSSVLKQRFAGAPLKRIAITFAGRTVRGEAMITEEGIEGGAIYALSSEIRDSVMRDGHATISIDLRPDIMIDALVAKLLLPMKGESFSNRLRKQIALAPVTIGLLHEAEQNATRLPPEALAGLIKALPVRIKGVRPIDRAISTAGGIRWDELDDHLMLRRIPGVFVAGEMLDWEAPTGGYLLQACFATGMAAAKGIDRYLDDKLS